MGLTLDLCDDPASSGRIVGRDVVVDLSEVEQGAPGVPGSSRPGLAMPREERLDFLIRRELAAPGLRQAFANPGDVSLLVLQVSSQGLVGKL